MYFYNKTINKFDPLPKHIIKPDFKIFDVSVGDLDNDKNNELVLSLQDWLKVVRINIYKFDGTKFNKVLDSTQHRSDTPFLAIANIDNDDKNGNELLMSTGGGVSTYRYDGHNINEIFTPHLLCHWAPGIMENMAAGDIDNDISNNELLIFCEGYDNDKVKSYRYNSDSGSFDLLDPIEDSFRHVLDIKVRDSTNTGYNNIIIGTANSIRSYHYEENLEQLEDYLKVEYKKVYLNKEGGPEYWVVSHKP